ncbi:hypothetical protein BH10CYA1_BH10CYA1_34180 [soil metagenome]
MKSSRLLLAATMALCLTSSVTASWSSSISERMSRALKQVEKKDYEGAVASYTEILSENPNSADAYLKRADARLQLKDFDGAISDYDQAVKVNSNFVESYVKRADLKVRLGDPQGAISDYSEALRLNPKDATAHTNRAIAYKLNGDYSKAADDCTWALNADPSALDALEERADCKMKANNLDGAIADYKSLFKKNKSKASHLNYNMGRALMLKGNKAEAREYFDQAIDYHSKALKNSHKNAEDYMKRGLTYIEMQEPDKAVDDFENAVAIAPDNAISHYQLGHLRLTMGDNKKAIEQLSASLKIEPKQNVALLDRAAAYANLGDFALAQKDLDSALIADKGAEVLLSRAFARLGMGDSSGAAADVQEAMNLSPKSVETKKEAVASIIASKEGHHDADLALAQNLEQMALLELTSNSAAAESLVKRAIEIQEKSLEKGNPKLAYSLMLLGRVQLKKSDPLKAEALFRAALLSLKHSSDGTQKYAIFNLEDCARLLMQSSSLEKAGAILSDTRMTRAMAGINERPLVGDTSRRAERAIEAYRLKKKNEQQLANGSAPPTSSSLSGNSSTASTSSPAVASTNASVSEHQQNVSFKPLRDKWALIVGISNFKDANINLHFPAKDAKDFADFLVKEKNFAPDHVKLLTDKTATRANILSMLGNKWLPRVAAPDDLVVIYFSGHGSSSSLDVGGVNYLVAHDTDVNDLYSTAIAMQDLTRIIKDRVHSNRVMIVLDACHSGAVAPNAKGLARPANVDIDPIVQGTGQLVISSSSPDQQSWESTRYQGSVFTKHLMDGLRKNGKMTNLGDAYSYLDSAVQSEVMRDRGMMQNPVMKSRWEGRALVIGVPPAAPSAGLGDIDLPDSGKSSAQPGTASKAKPHAATKPKAKGSFAKRAK